MKLANLIPSKLIAELKYSSQKDADASSPSGSQESSSSQDDFDPIALFQSASFGTDPSLRSGGSATRESNELIQDVLEAERVQVEKEAAEHTAHLEFATVDFFVGRIQFSCSQENLVEVLALNAASLSGTYKWHHSKEKVLTVSTGYLKVEDPTRNAPLFTTLSQQPSAKSSLQRASTSIFQDAVEEAGNLMSFAFQVSEIYIKLTSKEISSQFGIQVKEPFLINGNQRAY